MLLYHSQRAGELAQKVVFVKLGAAFVLIKHGKLQLLNLFKVVIYLEFHTKYWIQVVHSSLCSSQLKLDTNRGRD